MKQILTDLLDWRRALSKHTQGSMDHFPVELPGGAIVPKSNVLAISSQNVCGHLERTQDRIGEGRRDEWVPVPGGRGRWKTVLPTVLCLPANTFPFCSSTSLAWAWWLTMMTRWEPIIREYVCPYLPCSALKTTCGGLELHRLSMLPIRGSAGSLGGSLSPDGFSIRCSSNRSRAINRKTLRDRSQSISARSRGPCQAPERQQSEGRPRLTSGPSFYTTSTMSSPWLDWAVSSQTSTRIDKQWPTVLKHCVFIGSYKIPANKILNI